MIIVQKEDEISPASRMPCFWTFMREAHPLQHFSKQKKIFNFWYLWAYLHNFIKQNKNFSMLKKIENPLLNLPEN